MRLTTFIATSALALAPLTGSAQDPIRFKEIGRTTEKGLTLIPLRVYLKEGRLKCELALAKGRKVHDKREVSRQKTIDKETKQALSERK